MKASDFALLTLLAAWLIIVPLWIRQWFKLSKQKQLIEYKRGQLDAYNEILRRSGGGGQ